MEFFTNNWEIFLLNKKNVTMLKKKYKTITDKFIDRFNNDIGFNMFGI